MDEDDPVTTDRVFGQMPDGREVRVLTIGSDPGAVVEVLTLGATIHRLEVTCGDGVRRNVVLGHPDVAERLASSDYIGGTIGRYANRIAGGRFSLAGEAIAVRTHDRGNSLHGGPEGFDVRLWDVVSHTADEVVLSMVSPDGDQGFPGEVTARVRYRVSGDTVAVEMEATTDATTVVGMTNHAYVNLDGEDAGSIDDHLLVVDADDYTPVDATGIPLGEHAAGGRDAVRPPVACTAPVGARPQLRRARPRVAAPCVAHITAGSDDARGVERPARGAGLHGRHARRSALRAPIRRRPRAPGLPRLPEPPRVAVARPGAGGDLPVDDRVALQLLIMKTSGSGSGWKPTRA